ncbi:FabD/lysophospholipase-like protein [Meira miltonrushii]|uniref:Lysophospholipase n=1 Tax=Meira miltonrushii TaxID=1280837 RepID=A0A316VB52_9BASI|nr:FabD/lysophospholipase-like protein [Meira miltonrushii]PWN34867.1 FabD/lysophospholipase-like protein [Meira miltonrushii]
MPIARVIRHSPLYLYLKLYGLSVLVSLFASRPITGRLSGQTIQQIDRIRSAAEEALIRRKTDKAKQAFRDGRKQFNEITKVQTKHLLDALSINRKHNDFFTSARAAHTSQKNHSSHPFPYAIKTLALDADTHFPALPLQGVRQRVSRVVQRWGRRYKDLNMVKKMVKEDRQDLKRYPEIESVAHVRCSNSAHEEEIKFIRKRAENVASDAEFLKRLGIPASESSTGSVHPDDIPRIAIGGSGGGYRATFGFLASLQGLHSAKVFDSTFWISGVSGSCWTIAALFTVAQQDPNALLQHYKDVADEAVHPMSRGALDVVARSPKGVYFLLAPLLTKLRDGYVGIGIMDMYATLTSSYQLLSRSPHARPRLSRSAFAFSKMWQSAGIANGKAPMPIFTAVRIMHRVATGEKNGKIQFETKDASLSKPLPPSEEGRFSKTLFQWWEMNPLEVGSSEESAWVPTWSYGRGFVSGESVSKSPEISLSMLLGQATSAPAGPMTGYISTLLATLPQGTIMSKLLSKLNDFIRHKRWEKRWGNPIRGADEPNPLFGSGSRSEHNQKEWEGRRRLKLMDSGMSNNLPNHIFSTEARWADIVLAFDQSSDVQTGAALARLNEFAKERNLFMAPANDLAECEACVNSVTADEKASLIRQQFHGKYAQVFRVWKVKDDEFQPGLDLNPEHTPITDAEMYLIYCPLLPNACQPDFDPVTSSFSTSYNLVWKPEEIDILANTARANTIDYVIPTLKRVYRRMYKEKKARRLRGISHTQ